jgi:hypothetical protein
MEKLGLLKPQQSSKVRQVSSYTNGTFKNALHIEVSHLVDDGLQCLKVGEIIILNAFVVIQEFSFTILCTQKTTADVAEW